MIKELTIASKPESIREVEQFVEGIRDDLQFKDDVYGNVMVATTEAVNNSIIHGNKSDSSKTVKITFETQNQFRLVVKIVDQGDGFDHNSLKDPTAPENIENPGGRGVFLMQHLCDELDFDDDGRMVQMSFNI